MKQAITVSELISQLTTLFPTEEERDNTRVALFSATDTWDAPLTNLYKGRPAQYHLMRENPHTHKYAPLHSEFDSRFATEYTPYTKDDKLVILTDLEV